MIDPAEQLQIIARKEAFKEFLIKHPEYANGYAVIKRELAKMFPTDTENYQSGKRPFVEFINYKTGHATQNQLNAVDLIQIEPYNSAWPKLTEAEINAIKSVIDMTQIDALEHLGSTAVSNLSAKPIIDIFIGVKSIESAHHLITPLKTLGYIDWPDNPDPSHVRLFKGMPPFGKKRTHHIHILESTNPSFKHRVLFRDILRAHCKIRKEYENLKLQLAEKSAIDREAYTDAKADFIKKVLRNHGYKGPIER